MAFNFTDVVLATTNALEVSDLIPTVLPQRNWLVTDTFMKDGGNQLELRGGVDHDWMMNFAIADSTTWTTHGATRNPTFSNYTVKASLPLVFSYFEVAYLEHELEVNRAGTPREQAIAMVDVVKNRRSLAMLGWFKANEDRFFNKPSTSSNVYPYGLPYHLVPITSAQRAVSAEPTYQGTYPSGFSSWCGIDVSASPYTGLKSLNAAWDSASATITDAEKQRIAKMFLKLNFQAPMDFSDIKLPAYSKFKIITDTTVYLNLGAAAQKQNDQLGADTQNMMGVDLGKKNGGVILNGLPVIHCDTLDGDTYTGDTAGAYTGSHPLFMLNMDCWKLVKRAGKFMKKRPVASDPVHTPDQMVEYVDSEFNYKLIDRQKGGGVISWVA